MTSASFSPGFPDPKYFVQKNLENEAWGEVSVHSRQCLRLSLSTTPPGGTQHHHCSWGDFKVRTPGSLRENYVSTQFFFSWICYFIIMKKDLVLTKDGEVRGSIHQPLFAQNKWIFLHPKGMGTCTFTLKYSLWEPLSDVKGMRRLGVLPLSGTKLPFLTRWHELERTWHQLPEVNNLLL